MRHIAGNNLTYSIVQELGASIVSGAYSSKDTFPTEADLCKQFGASRSVLREAVKMLTAKGLMGARPRQGTWVEPESSWNFLDPDVLGWLLQRKLDIALLEEFTEMRLAVEPLAASLAAKRAQPGDLMQIKNSLMRMRAAERGDDDPYDADVAFHVAILAASRNRLIAQLQELISTALRFSIRLTNRFKGVAFASVEAHEAVASAISGRRPQAAAKAMTSIINEAMELIRACKETDRGKTSMTSGS